MVARHVSLEKRKKCPCCEELLPLSAFGRNRQSKDGLHYYCKACAASKQKKWAKANPTKVKAMRQAYIAQLHRQNAERDPYEAQAA